MGPPSISATIRAGAEQRSIPQVLPSNRICGIEVVLIAQASRDIHQGLPPLSIPCWTDGSAELATLNRSRLTIRAYLNDLQQFLEWLGPHRGLLAVEPTDVRKAMTAAGLAPEPERAAPRRSCNGTGTWS
jgi:hypothetical protein